MHPSFDRPKDGVFTAKSFRIVYQLAAKGATVKQLDEKRFELAAGSVRAVIHIMENSSFDGQPIVWRTEQVEGRASLVGICYEGDAKAFAIPQMGEIRIAVALELLQGNQQPSAAPIRMVDSDFETANDGRFYGVVWSGLGDDVPLLSPRKPTNR